MSGKLAGRKVLVTGAASGMGRDIARLFAAEGAALALLDRNAVGLARSWPNSAWQATATSPTAIG